MDQHYPPAWTHLVTTMPSRRDVLRAIAAVGLGLGIARWPGFTEARKKRKRRRKNKKKCGKAGGKPVKGKCCKGSTRVDGRCRRCDVCARGCAFRSVQAAIDAADNGDTVAICPGTYRGNLSIAKDLRLIGAGDGNGASNTLVQGLGDDSVVRIEASVVGLENVRISGGVGDFGGGIYTEHATVELIGCTVTENEAIGHGGGINNNGTLALTGCTVTENEAGFFGGGIDSGGTLILTGSEISGNTANAGGGINNSQATIELINSRVIANSARSAVGGIRNEGGTVICRGDSTVSGNTAGVPGPANCVDVNGGTGCAACPN